MRQAKYDSGIGPDFGLRVFSGLHLTRGSPSYKVRGNAAQCAREEPCSQTSRYRFDGMVRFLSVEREVFECDPS